MTEHEKVNILLVDDQPAKLLSYEVILHKLDENLIKASSGQEALEYLLKSEVAVVLMDVCMPDLDGFQLAAMIREHPRFQKTAMIFISAIHLTDMDRLRRQRDDRKLFESLLVSDFTHGLIAIHFRHHDVHQHDRQVRRRFDECNRFVAGGRGQDVHTAPLQHTAQGEDVSGVVVNEKHRLADEILVRVVQAIEHALLVGGQVRHHPMQEQRGFVQQPLRRLDSLDDDASRHRV